LLIAFTLILLITREFDDQHGKYTAFGQNFMMSVLFITMLVSRGNVAGQSVYIALFKLMGTAIPSLVYLLMVFQTSVASGLNPWLRF
jgi:hypothetical protein